MGRKLPLWLSILSNGFTVQLESEKMIIISVTRGSRKEEGIFNDISTREEKISSSQVNIDKVYIWRKN